MAFGISFGKKKQSGSSTTNVNKTESIDQTETGTKTSSGTTSTTGSTQTAQQQTSTQAGQSAQVGTSSTTGQSTQFGEGVLTGLESAVGQLLGAIPTQTRQLDSDFNKEAFIQSGMDAASSRIQGDTEAALNSIFDSIGGRDDSNSMATLLATRARGDAAAALAGAKANLTGQAESIARENFGADLAGLQNNQSFLTQVLAALKGGRATTAEDTTAAQLGSTSQVGQTTTVGQETTQQTQVQELVEALNSALKGTTTTVGTESTKSKGKTSGGGFGLSI